MNKILLLSCIMLPLIAMDRYEKDFILVIASKTADELNKESNALNQSPEDDASPLLAGIKRSDSSQSDSSGGYTSAQVVKLEQHNEQLLKLSYANGIDDVDKFDIDHLLRINSEEIVKHQDPFGHYSETLERVKKIKAYETIDDDDSDASGDSVSSQDFDKVTLTVNQHTELLDSIPLMMQCLKTTIDKQATDIDGLDERLKAQEATIHNLQQQLNDVIKKIAKEKFQ